MALPAIAARLGVEVLEESIKGVFGLASATVSAAGEAAKGVGTAVGGALEGAMSPAPVTVVNNVGMAGEAAKAKVSGGGALPAAPKKTAKPVANAKMPTEKLLVIAVNYLSSIEKTLEAQLNFERIAASQQAAAEKEAAIEADANQATSPYKSLGEKLGAIKDNAADRAGAMTKILLGGTALAGFGLLGLGEMDTSELDRLKNNWEAFREQYKWMFDFAEKFYDLVGGEAGIAAIAAGSLLGWRGALAGFIYAAIAKATGSEEFGAAAAAAGVGLTTKLGRNLAGRGAMAAGRFVLANPFAALAAATTGGLLYGLDSLLKYEEDRTRTPYEAWYRQNGMYPKYSGSPAVVIGFSIRMPDRNINVTNISVAQLRQNTRTSDPFFYWDQVRLRGPNPRWKSETDADTWLRTRGQAWLDEKYPKVANATAVTSTQPDATPSRSGTISGAPVADAETLANLPPIPADIEKILATIRTRESGGNYGAQNPESTASGAYQFIDGTWRSLTEKYGIGTEYRKAKFAPPEIQDAVAAKYVEEILARAGGDVTKVPLEWFTGNIQGQSDHASPQEVANYQRAWMDTYTGGQYSGSSYDLQASQSSGLGSALWSLGEGAMEAIGNIIKAATDTRNMTTVPLGSQMSGTTTSSSTDMPQATSAGGGTASAITPETNTTTRALTDISTSLQNAVDLGLTESTQANITQETTAQASIRNANASNDGKLECLDPNFPGMGGVEAYLQYYRMAA